MKKTDLKKLSALLLVITTIFFSGCSVNTVSLKTVTLDDVIKNVNTKNAQKLKSVSTYDEADFLIDVNSESFTDEELKAMSSSGYRMKVHSRKGDRQDEDIGCFEGVMGKA